MQSLFKWDYVRNLKTCISPQSDNLKFEATNSNSSAEMSETSAAAPSKKKIEERHRMRYGGHDEEMPSQFEPDGFKFPWDLYCDVCGSFHKNQVEENLEFLWLGIGAEEHCWKCGAEPENHDPFYSQRFENWRMDFIFDEMERIQKAYTSLPTFMTRAQIEKNRVYLRTAIEAALKSDLDHWPERYDLSVARYQYSALSSRVTQLAVIKYEGDSEKAFKEYNNVSSHMDHLCTMLSELEINIPLPPFSIE